MIRAVRNRKKISACGGLFYGTTHDASYRHGNHPGRAFRVLAEARGAGWIRYRPRRAPTGEIIMNRN